MPRHKNTTKRLTRHIKSKMIPFSLWLVRHGETMENRNNIYQGQTDTKLSDVGIQQAQMVARRLQDIKFTHIYSSDLQRAWKTAEYILDSNHFKDGLAIVKDPRVKEKGFGVFEGKSKAEVQEFLKTVPDPTHFAADGGGETVLQLYTRVKEFLNELCVRIAQMQVKKRKNNAQTNNEEQDEDSSASGSDNESQPSQGLFEPVANVLLVVHGGTIRQFIHHFARKVPCEFFGVSKRRIAGLSPNTGVSKFEIYLDEGGGISLSRCTMLLDGAHLDAEAVEIDADHAL